jgi:hypothetical protein
MILIYINIGTELAELLGDTPEEIERRARESIVLELYRRRDLPAGHAAKALGLDEVRFVRWAGEQGVPDLDMAPEGWARELRANNKE